MSQQKDVLRRVAAAVNARRGEDAERCFGDTFVLHDPSAPGWPRGREGVHKMVQSFFDFAPDTTLDILDMVEEGDRVAVRWRVSGTREGAKTIAAIVAIYRFADGLIVEDWGTSARAPWDDA